MRIPRSLAAATALSLAVLGLAACSGSDDASEPSETVERPATEDVNEEPEDDASEAEEPVDEASASAAAWANPVSTGGELLTSITGTKFRVDVYQVGVTQATQDGGWFDRETGEPLLPEGSDIVFVNYVVTNTSNETLQLGQLMINVFAEYADWSLQTPMDTVSDDDLFEEMGVNSEPEQLGSFTGENNSLLAFEPGTSFAFGDNFGYQPGSPITFYANYIPVDEQGDYLDAQKEQFTADATIN